MRGSDRGAAPGHGVVLFDLADDLGSKLGLGSRRGEAGPPQQPRVVRGHADGRDQAEDPDRSDDATKQISAPGTSCVGPAIREDGIGGGVQGLTWG